MVENKLNLPEGFELTGWQYSPTHASRWCHLVHGDTYAIITVSRYEEKINNDWDVLMRAKIMQAVLSIRQQGGKK